MLFYVLKLAVDLSDLLKEDGHVPCEPLGEQCVMLACSSQGGIRWLGQAT